MPMSLMTYASIRWDKQVIIITILRDVIDAIEKIVARVLPDYLKTFRPVISFASQLALLNQNDSS